MPRQLVPPLANKGAKENGKDKIPDELIVKLKSGSKTNINELAQMLGAKVIGRSDGLNSYRLKFESEDAANAARQTLASNSDIASTDSNYTVAQPTRPRSPRI